VNESEAGRNLLRDALAVLSLPPDEQLRVNGPGCMVCDLLEDFDHARTCARESPSAQLSDEQRVLLDQMVQVIKSMSESDLECFNEEVVKRPAWQQLRELAGTTLRKFGWEDAIVSPLIEVKPGVWRRPSNDG
jgi:hypothetical protein